MGLLHCLRSRSILAGVAVLVVLGAAGLISPRSTLAWPHQMTRPEGPCEHEFVVAAPTRGADGVAKLSRIHLRRLIRLGAPPVILSHAVVLTNLAMRQLGEALWEAGFDVWMPNMRGHGNGTELSDVVPYAPGDYNFDHIVTDDWPALLGHVFEATQQKVHVIGYSMGGMTWEQCLSGVYKDESGAIRQSDLISAERLAMVASFVPLVAPPDLHELSSTIKCLLHPFLPLLRSLHTWIPLTTSDTHDTRGALTWRETLRRILVRTISHQALRLFPGGIIALENSGDRHDDFVELASDRISSPHTDYMTDLIGWFYETYASRDKRVDYGQNKRIKVPTLLIVASEDRVTPPWYAITRARSYPTEAALRILFVRGYSHLDIVLPRAHSVLAPPLIAFLKDPLALMQVGEMLFVGPRVDDINELVSADEVPVRLAKAQRGLL